MRKGTMSNVLSTVGINVWIFEQTAYSWLFWLYHTAINSDDDENILTHAIKYTYPLYVCLVDISGMKYDKCRMIYASAGKLKWNLI